MTSGYRNSAGTDTDNLFDPDVIGDGPSATGYKKSDGTLLKYAAAKYGTVGPNTGYRLSNGADTATLWAAKGTASYALGFDGLYSAQNAGRNNIILTFNSTSSWTVTTNGTWVSEPGTSGSLNTYGTVTEFYLHVVNSGTSPAVLTTATRDAWTPITSGLLVAEFDTVTLTGDATTCEFTLALRNSAGTVLSNNTTSFTIHNTNPP